ncbi:ATP-binding protein [Streptomyces sp. NPDC004629]|uniref:ATP-binding protein n=1 Tax=Streptomyces sp. NPDC004629 TaxID=3364705 RepID=UPI0036CE6CC3
MSTIMAIPNATGAPGYTSDLPCNPKSVQPARRLVAEVLRTWGVPDSADVAELVVSELLTNSINHTACAWAKVVVELRQGSIVRIGVADGSHASPHLRTTAETAERGRGLFLVDAVCWRWGYDLHGWGKVTWAEVQVPAADKSR